MKCDKHPERGAIAACVRCGRGICEDCRLQLAGKNYCQECADKLVAEKQKQKPQKAVSRKVETEEGLDAGEAIVICLFSPIAGAIAWLLWHDTKPKKAQEACIIAIILFVVWLVIYIVYLASIPPEPYYY